MPQLAYLQGPCLPCFDEPEASQYFTLTRTLCPDHITLFGEWRLSQERMALRDAGFFGRGDLTQTTQQAIFGGSYRF